MQLRHALRNHRVALAEIQVFLFGGHRNRIHQPVLHTGEVALYHQPEKAFELRDLPQQLLFGLWCEHQQFTIFERFDKLVAGLLLMKTGDIAYPPVFDRKLQDHLETVFVDKVTSDAAFVDIRFKITDCPLLQQKCLLFHFSDFQQRMKDRQFFIGKNSARFVDVPVDGMERFF